MPSLECGSLGASRSHICFLRAWISARHSLEALSQHWWTAPSPADIGLRAGPLRPIQRRPWAETARGPGAVYLPGLSHAIEPSLGKAKCCQASPAPRGGEQGKDGIKPCVCTGSCQLGGGSPLEANLRVFAYLAHTYAPACKGTRSSCRLGRDKSCLFVGCAVPKFNCRCFRNLRESPPPILNVPFKI